MWPLRTIFYLLINAVFPPKAWKLFEKESNKTYSTAFALFISLALAAYGFQNIFTDWIEMAFFLAGFLFAPIIIALLIFRFSNNYAMKAIKYQVTLTVCVFALFPTWLLNIYMPTQLEIPSLFISISSAWTFLLIIAGQIIYLKMSTGKAIGVLIGSMIITGMAYYTFFGINF
jgi:hypothetical protein